MTLRDAARVVLCALFLSAAPAARAAAPSSSADRLSVPYLKNAARDAAGIAASPARWERRDWLAAGGVLGGAAVLYAGADLEARKAVRRNRSWEATRGAAFARSFGDGLYLVPALGAAYLGGAAGDDRRLRRTALEGAEALGVSELFVGALKMTAGRSRPFEDRGRGDWHGPSSTNARWSFPSGHTSAAFSVAAVVAGEYGDRAFVPPLAYGLAALTGLSRVYDDKHWASDVFVGGALGYFSAQAVLRRWKARESRVTLVPLLDGSRAGVLATARF
jgi:membrane-associated phospholipid phosphatase